MRKLLMCFVMVSMAGVVYAVGNSPVAPSVSIISPQDGTATNLATIDVTVSFKASANPTDKAKTNTGNVSLLILKIDNNEISRYENPPNIKEGSHTFSVDISHYPDSIVSLQAYAYQGNINAGLVGLSNIVQLIIDRTPPIVNAALTPLPNTFGWNNTNVTVHFDATDNLSGVVSVTPDIILTQEGKEQVVTGEAQDKAGNTGSVTVIVNIDKTPPQIVISHPPDGITLDTNTPLIRLTYSDALSGLSLSTLLGTINDIDRTSEFTIGDGEATLQIISNNPLPEGENIIFVRIKDNADNSNQATSTFTISTIKVPPITPESGFIHGQVFDAKTNIVLEDAEVTLQGIESKVFTDSQGKWTFPTPAEGAYFLTITKQGYNYNQRHVSVVSGRDVAVEPAHLLPIDVSTHITVTEGGAVTNTNGTMEVVFPPGALPNDEDISLTLIENVRELPDKLPDNVAFVSAFYGNPSINFNEPVKVRIKNRHNFPANLTIPIGFWNRQEGKWEARGMGKVSSDGKWLEGDWTGFSSGGFFFARIPPPQAGPPGEPDNDTPAIEPPECGANISSTIGLKSGSLSIEESLPSIRSLGISDSLNFTYTSKTANPGQLIATQTTLNPVTTIIPQRTGWKLQIEGNLMDVKFDGVSGQTIQRHLFDGKNERGEYLKTGSYPYEINISNEYQANFATTNVFGGPPLQDTGVPSGDLVPFTTTIKGRTIINNQIYSPYGSGWGIEGLQRLHFDPDGKPLLTQGDGPAIIFSNGPFAYVANGSNNVSVIDTSTNTIVATISVGYIPRGVAITSNDRFAYVTNTGSHNVSVIDTSTNTIVATVPVGGGIGGKGCIAIAPDDRFAYVTGGRIDNVSVIDTSTNTVVSTVSVGEIPVGIAVTPDSKYVYVTNAGSGNVSVIDTSSNTVISTVPVGRFPYEVTITPDGRFAYVANAGSSNVSVIDTSTNTVVATVSVGRGPAGVAITPDARYAYVANAGSRNVSVIDISTNTVMATIPVGSSSVDIAITPDARYAYVITGSRNVSVIDISTNTVMATVSIGPNTQDIALTSALKNTFLPPSGDFSRLVRNADSTYTRIMKDGTKVNFNTEGLQTSKIDRNSNVATYEHTDANNDGEVEELSKITLPTGQIYTFTYNENGKLAGVQDPANRTTQFSIDTNGNLSQITYPDGSSKSWTYNPTHLMLTQTDQQGNITEYIYDEYGKIKETHSPERDIASVDALGNVTVTRGQEVHKFKPQDVVGLLNELPEGEGTPDNPASVVRPETVRYTATEGCSCAGTTGKRDKFGNTLELTDALGRTTKIERDINGNPTKTTRPNGAVTTMTYDGRGNLLTVKDESTQATTTYTYEPNFNQVTSIKDSSFNLTTISYDERGNSIQNKDAMNNPTTFTYDSRGLLTSIKDALNNPTTFTHDPTTGNLLTTQDPLGNTTSLTYDSAGNVITSQDAEGRITQFVYDNMNRLTSVTDADNKTTQYQYDLSGNLTKVIDAKGNQTQFIYNERNQLIQTINPLEVSEYIKYDANRNIAATINRNGDTIAFDYDKANQLIKKFLPGNQITASDYDNAGNLTSIIDPDSSLGFTYDLTNRLISTSTIGSPYQPAVTLSYTYDKNGNRKTLTDPQGTTNYAYDTLNRLTSLTNPQGKTTTFGYDILSRRRSLTHANGTSTTYDYNIASQLTSLINAKGVTAISKFDYSYNRVGNRITMTESAGVNNYGYDVLNQLLNATHPQPENPPESFNYDPVGNRLSSHLSSTHRYDKANRLLEDDLYLCTYDNNGNLTEKFEKSTSKTTSYYYDVENQLIAILSPDWNLAEYRYDGQGRRIEKKITQAGGPITTTRYIYDKEDILFEYDGTNTLLTRYTHGPGIDEPLIMRRSGQDYFYHVDGLGSVKEITDTTGTVVQTYAYDSFGKIVIQTGNVINPYTYTGREYDPESGLYYYRARYYDPKIGRFISEDPIGLKSGDVNLYRYVWNNPVNYIDPEGLFALDPHTAVCVACFALLGKDAMLLINDCVIKATKTPCATTPEKKLKAFWKCVQDNLPQLLIPESKWERIIKSTVCSLCFLRLVPVPVPVK